MEVDAIYEGDNIEVLAKFPSESVHLIYADPPFFSNKQYEIIWNDGAEIRSFEDRWKGGIEHYIQWMEPRLRECHRVLKPTGQLYLHCDWHASAHLRILLDKIFGARNFRNEIVWFYPDSPGRSSRDFPSKHDIILRYVKSERWTFNDKDVRVPILEESKERYKTARVLGGRSYVGGRSAEIGKIPEDVWRIPVVKQNSQEAQGYPTQKPLALLERIIKASSDKGDIVLDPFCGCGTTLVAAQRNGRRWVGVDVSPTAVKLVRKRLQKECGTNAHVIRGDVDMKYLQKLSPFDFQNWVVVDKFLGRVNPKKSGDLGIDGLTSPMTGSHPIQVKQSDGVGRNVIDNFETAMRRLKKAKGYIVAFSFAKGAYEEAARVKNQEGLEIILRTVKELLEGQVE